MSVGERRVGTPPRVLDTQALAWLSRPTGARGPTELSAPAWVGLSGTVGSGQGTEEEVERGVGGPLRSRDARALARPSLPECPEREREDGKGRGETGVEAFECMGVTTCYRPQHTTSTTETHTSDPGARADHRGQTRQASTGGL